MNSKYNFLIVPSFDNKYGNPEDITFVKRIESNNFKKVFENSKCYRFEHNKKDCSIYILRPSYARTYPLYGYEYIDNDITLYDFNGFVAYSVKWTEALRKYLGTIFNSFYDLIDHINSFIPDGYEYIDTDTTTRVPIEPLANFVKKYCEEDIKRVNEIFGMFSPSSIHKERKNTMNKYFEIKNVIFNDPATIIFWKDGTKTVTKCGEKDIYDPEKGLAMCLAKRALGDKGNYYETFKKWLPEETTEKDKRYGDVTFAFTSVDLASTTDKTTEAMQKLPDVLTYDGHHEEAINYIAENKYGDRYDTRLFFAGKKHKIVCAGDCYHVKNIKKENSLVYFTLKDAINDGCIPCKHCEGMHKRFIPEGLVRSCRNCKHRKNCSSFLPCYNPETKYASSKETPSKKWDDVTTTLEELDTSKLHYVKVPENHIVIDFDIKGDDGSKSFERNVEEASKWPKTYAELSKSGSGVHLHYIYSGDVSKLSSTYDENIEVKVFSGKSSLRRKLTKCNNYL